MKNSKLFKTKFIFQLNLKDLVKMPGILTRNQLRVQHLMSTHNFRKSVLCIMFYVFSSGHIRFERTWVWLFVKEALRQISSAIVLKNERIETRNPNIGQCFFVKFWDMSSAQNIFHLTNLTSWLKFSVQFFYNEIINWLGLFFNWKFHNVLIFVNLS